MNRAARRGLARVFGRAQANDERLERLERENETLKATVAGLEAKHDALPGVSEERKDWFLLVGGKRVELRALPPIEWVRSQEELPGFLFAFTTDRLSSGGGQLGAELLDKIADLARRWITASAVDLTGVNLDHLTLPEAEHAVAHIASLNGVTDSLRAWFRQRLTRVADVAPDGESVRGAPEQPAGDHLN